MRFAKTFVEVVADKKLATCVELKDIKDVKDTIYSMPYGANTNSLIVKKTEIIEGLFSKKEVEVGYFINPNYYICPNCGLVLPVISKADLEILFKQENTDE